MSELDLTNVNGNLPENRTKQIIQTAVRFDIIPSLMISQLYLETYWGATNSAVQNNNWGGSSYFYSSSPYTRPSGIIVERGTARPSSEGAHYMKFESVEDYFFDYGYLLAEQGIYKVKGEKDFDTAIKGLFKAGGASSDYAAMNWLEYTNLMKGIRSGINNRNNNILDRIDENPNDYIDGIDPDPEPEPPGIDLEAIFKEHVFKYSKNFIGNKFFKITQIFENVFDIEPTEEFYKYVKETDPDPDPDPEPEPDPEPGKMYFPLNPKAQGVNFWTPPDQPNMDYGGERSGRKHWAYDIGTLGNENVSCHSVRAGEVISVNADNLGTVVIKNSTDNYFVQYMHLQLGKFTVSKGDQVTAGQKIGMVGGTGGYDIHLHIAVSINGTFGTEKDTINPRPYLKITGNNKTDLPSPV